MNLIVPEEGKGGSGSGRMNYVKVIGKGEMGFRGDGKEAVVPDLRSLEEWARRYCEDQSSIKRFVFLPEILFAPLATNQPWKLVFERI